MQLGKSCFAEAVDGHEAVLAAFFSLHFRGIDVLIADGVVLELLFRWAQPVFALAGYSL
jgi:hypothetical protein